MNIYLSAWNWDERPIRHERLKELMYIGFRACIKNEFWLKPTHRGVYAENDDVADFRGRIYENLGGIRQVRGSPSNVDPEVPRYWRIVPCFVIAGLEYKPERFPVGVSKVDLKALSWVKDCAGMRAGDNDIQSHRQHPATGRMCAALWHSG
jgi:hypothetical protein